MFSIRKLLFSVLSLFILLVPVSYSLAQGSSVSNSPSSVITTAQLASDLKAQPTDSSKPSISESNPYGLAALWAQGDWVAKMTLAVLVVMSMGSWYVIFIKFAEQARLNRQAKDVQDRFWKAATIGEAVETLAVGSAFREIAEKGLESLKINSGMFEAIDQGGWVSMNIQRAMGHLQSRMQNGLAFLATVGSTAPFVGLFGTVWGIYNALVKIGMSGQASIDKVAGPVGESLIMTAIGLAVAVPAVLGYNWLVRRNKVVMEQVNAFGADLNVVLLSSLKKIN